MDDLVSRVRTDLNGLSIEEKRMFGGTTFMLDGHMLCCVSPDGLMVRVGADDEPLVLRFDGARRYRPGIREMVGFIVIPHQQVGEPDVLRFALSIARSYVATLPPKAWDVRK